MRYTVSGIQRSKTASFNRQRCFPSHHPTTFSHPWPHYIDIHKQSYDVAPKTSLASHYYYSRSFSFSSFVWYSNFSHSDFHSPFYRSYVSSSPLAAASPYHPFGYLSQTHPHIYRLLWSSPNSIANSSQSQNPYRRRWMRMGSKVRSDCRHSICRARLSRPWFRE